MTSADPKSTAITKPVPAIVTAGDSRAAKAVYGKSKVYLEVADRPLVEHVVLIDQGEVLVEGPSEAVAADKSARKHYLGENFSLLKSD